MSETSSSEPRLHSRRQVLRGAGLAGPFAAFAGLRASGQDRATPGATPGASPVASPEASPTMTPSPSPTPQPPTPTPTPDPIPETALRIVRQLRPAYGGAPVTGGDLRLHVQRADLLDFNPAAQRQDFQVLTSLYDPLVWIDSVTMRPEPWIAESWSWSDDGLVLSFVIREGVSFHDGSPLTAEDVRFSLQAYRDDYESAMAGFYALIADISLVDARIVAVTFAEPDGAFLYNGASQPIFSSAQYLGHWESRPVGERSLSGYDWASDPPLGTGPWSFAEAQDDRIVLARNSAYWQAPPHFDRLVMLAEDDRAARIQAWKNGDVDLVFPVGGRDLDTASVWRQEGALYAAQAPVAMFAAFNFANPANATADMMGDPALRRALTLAIDRDRYAREVFHTFIDEAKAGTITQPWAHDARARNPARDLEEANRLLDEAGWFDSNLDGMREHPTGNVLDLWCIVSNQERPELLALLELLKEDFAQVGARLTVQHIEPDTFDTRWVENRMYDMIAYTLVQYPAFAEFDLYGTAWDIRINPRGWNPGGYSNPVVDEAIQEYFAAWTGEGMEAALAKLQAAANEDLFGLWFGFPNDLVLARPDIQGFQPHMYFQGWNTRFLWRGEYIEVTPVPTEAPATPAATPDVTPAAAPGATPMATPST